MNKEDKRIFDSYKSVEIPKVDLESRINEKIRGKDKIKYKRSFRTVLVFCVVIVATSTIAFAISEIIHNLDGSHTLVSESGDKAWTVHSEDPKENFTYDRKRMFNKLMEQLVQIKVEGDEAKVGYLKYSEEEEALFAVLAAYDTYFYDEETMEFLEAHKDTPEYLSDVVTELSKNFKIDRLDYFYSVNQETQEILKVKCENESHFGEVYTDVVPVERELFNINISLLSKDMDKYYNTAVSLSEKGVVHSSTTKGVDYETITINERSAMLSKRADGNYILVVEVDGIGVFIDSNPRGDINNLYELCEGVIEVLENKIESD